MQRQTVGVTICTAERTLDCRTKDEVDRSKRWWRGKRHRGSGIGWEENIALLLKAVTSLRQ